MVNLHFVYFPPRSVALSKLGRPDLSASDILRALSAGYPRENAHRLLLRLVKCREEQSDEQGVKDALKELEKSLKDSTSSSKKKNEIVTDARQSLLAVKRAKGQRSDTYLNFGSCATDPDPKCQEEEFFRTCLDIKEPSPDVPCASAALRMERDPVRGRYAVAAR